MLALAATGSVAAWVKVGKDKNPSRENDGRTVKEKLCTFKIL
jgi:hypothetical protein